MNIERNSMQRIKKPLRTDYGRKTPRLSDLRVLWASRVFIWVVIVLTMFPMIWVIASSFSKGDSFFLESVFPEQFSMDNYINLFTDTDFTLWVMNSMKLCMGVAIIQLFLTTTAAYAFSRMRFYGRKYGLMSLMLLQIFPSAMSLAAIYILIYRFNLMDNFWALILLLSGGSAYNIWLLKQYFDQLPKELDEAAVVDGAGHFQVFWKIILPLASPMLVVIFLFSFIGVYSEFIITSVVAQSPENYTIAVGLRTFINEHFSAHWTLFSAASTLASIPIMIIFMLLQKYIQGGLAAGGVKG